MANENNVWAKHEFGNSILGDKRLTDRLVSMPESSINQACESWSEANAFFKIRIDLFRNSFHQLEIVNSGYQIKP